MGKRKQQRVSAAMGKRAKAEAEVQAFVDRFFPAVDDDGLKYASPRYAPPWPASELDLVTQVIIDRGPRAETVMRHPPTPGIRHHPGDGRAGRTTRRQLGDRGAFSYIDRRSLPARQEVEQSRSGAMLLSLQAERFAAVALVPRAVAGGLVALQCARNRE